VTLTVDAERAENLLDEARRVLDDERAIVMDLEAHQDVESRTTTLSFSVRTTQRLQAALVVKKLGGLEGVRRAAWS
jgi:(p)ppGpp synthase/HD superfamily hydrolase